MITARISAPTKEACQLPAACKHTGVQKNDQTIFVFCPAKDKERIHSTLMQNNILHRINEYSASFDSDSILCHFKSWNLPAVQQNKLIDATKTGAWVEPLTCFLDRYLGYTEIDLLHEQYFLHQKAFPILSRKRHAFIKRIFDVTFALLLLILTLPICLLTALAIKYESEGPVLFRQRRTGQHDKEFEVIKFRSMTIDAEKYGAQWASKNDSRVTTVGSFIRKTRIDELPQLINVIRGEMSLIGPRPEREVFIQELEKVIPYYRFRHTIKPGISGLAQVKYSYGASIEDAVWKHKYDTYYIKHHNMLLDIKILLWTVRTVLFRMGQ